jgi:hypothetical protein
MRLRLIKCMSMLERTNMWSNLSIWCMTPGISYGTSSLSARLRIASSGGMWGEEEAYAFVVEDFTYLAQKPAVTLVEIPEYKK